MKILTRDISPRCAWALEQAGVPALLAQLYAARGVQSLAELDNALPNLLAPDDLRGAQAAASLLADAIAQGKKLCVVADYDCDGATACAVAVRGLRLLGAQHVGFIVPDRVVDGYGLTAPIAQRVKDSGADVLITVDNGIASFEGVAHARALGLQVLVTDHHLPAVQQGQEPGQAALPAAHVVVNPNQPGCGFASKHLAGVGVMFYVLLALRRELRQRGAFAQSAAQPKLDSLLPLVALGTVTDLVKLDANNRRLVAQGLKRVRLGAMPLGMRCLFEVAKREFRSATTFDFGFALGPRINAAGRLADMTLGIACLLSDDPDQASQLAQTLDAINRERRDIEDHMREQALNLAESLFAGEDAPPAVCVFDPNFHEGVVGIVAARLKDKLHRPAFVLAASNAPGKSHELKGSGRSIAGFHLRDALDLIAKRHPNVLLRFGGHAMAAGCSLERANLGIFEAAFRQVAQEWLDPATLMRQLDTDGPLKPEYRRTEVVDMLEAQVWGQGFAAPVFSEELEVLSQRLVGEKHLALKLRHQGQPVDGIWFGHATPLPARVKLAFRLDADTWNGLRRVRFLIQAAEL
jgi:single-stranded-DNA-specific exonuclease